MLNQDIGKRIRERRKEVGISATQLADKLNLAKATIYRYENGDIKVIKLPVVESIADILNCNPAWLIGKSDEKYIVRNTPVQPTKDVFDNLNDVIQMLLNDNDVTFNGLSLKPSDKLALVNDIESITELMFKRLKSDK